MGLEGKEPQSGSSATGTSSGDLTAHRGGFFKTSLATPFGVLFWATGLLVLIITLWIFKLIQTPEEGAKCLWPGEVATTSSGKPVVCQDGLIWKSVN